MKATITYVHSTKPTKQHSKKRKRVIDDSDDEKSPPAPQPTTTTPPPHQPTLTQPHSNNIWAVVDLRKKLETAEKERDAYALDAACTQARNESMKKKILHMKTLLFEGRVNKRSVEAGKRRKERRQQKNNNKK